MHGWYKNYVLKKLEIYLDFDKVLGYGSWIEKMFMNIIRVLFFFEFIKIMKVMEIG